MKQVPAPAYEIVSLNRRCAATPEGKRGVKAYKILRVRRDGSLGPLFINRHQRIPLGQWLVAKDHPTKGFAHRPGWHCAPRPVAPHLKLHDNRVWMEVRVYDYRKLVRPHIQGGAWLLAKWMKVVGPVKGGVA